MKKTLNLFLILIALLLFAPALAAADSICPDPEEALNSSPSGLADVQAEIDRLELCVERTRLLDELNRMIDQQNSFLEERTKKVRKNLRQDFLPQLQPMENLRPQQIERLSSDQLTGNSQGKQNADKKSNQQAESESAKIRWSIIRIWGQSSHLQAQLLGSNGRTVTVRQGDSLPVTADYETPEVVELTAHKVVIRRGQSNETLNWHSSS